LKLALKSSALGIVSEASMILPPCSQGVTRFRSSRTVTRIVEMQLHP